MKTTHDNTLLIQEGVDLKILQFLVRHINVEEKTLSDDPEFVLKVKSYKFNGLPGYSYNSFNTKKQIEYRIYEMLYENNITNIELTNERKKDYDKEQQRLIKTIRVFLKYIN